jgi:hypothetical protein
MKRLLAPMLATLFFAALVAGCHPGEGERCNPMLFTDECPTNLACIYPEGCGVAYCCPNSGPSAEPNCQPCSADGGVTD